MNSPRLTSVSAMRTFAEVSAEMVRARRETLIGLALLAVGVVAVIGGLLLGLSGHGLLSAALAPFAAASLGGLLVLSFRADQRMRRWRHGQTQRWSDLRR